MNKLTEGTIKSNTKDNGFKLKPIKNPPSPVKSSLDYLLSILNEYGIRYKLDTTGEIVNYLEIRSTQLMFTKENNKCIGVL